MRNLSFSFFIFSDAVLRHIAENGKNSDPKMKLNIEKTTHDGCLITMFEMHLKI
jgi:hypothetical protein